MSAFPRLKTDAVMQYPAGRSFEYSNFTLRFVDGTEQRYREFGAPLRQWRIRLDLLDETELANLQEFFIAHQGRFGSFSFTDPRDDIEYADCSFDHDTFQFDLVEEMRANTILTVRENRN